MALAKIKQFIKEKKLETKISDLVKAELGKTHVESYIYSNVRIEEWAKWACSSSCLDLVGQGHYTAAEVRNIIPKMRKEFMAQAKHVFKGLTNQYMILDLPQGGLEITQTTQNNSTFQPSIKDGHDKTIVNKIGSAKEAALQAVPILKKGGTALRKPSMTTEEKRLGGAMTKAKSALHGHHGGANATSQDATGRDLPPTTAGLIVGRDAIKNSTFKDREYSDMKDDAIQATKDEILYDIVMTSLLKWFDFTLEWNRTPRSHNIGGINYTYAQDIIYVDFALGDGLIGKENTAFRRAYDAHASNGVTAKIDAALIDIETKVENLVKQWGLANQGNLVALRGSPSTKDNVLDVTGNMIIDKLVKGMNKKNVRVTRNKVRTPKSSTFKQKIKKSKVTSAILLNKGKKHKTVIKRNSTASAAKRDTVNIVGLKEILNQTLPEKLLANMGSPALNNQTGRFRQSARVTNVIVGPRGGTQIDYTYMKNPYKMYEPGGERGSTARDPRKLIGGTIREMAADIMEKKFIKVRSV